MESKGKKWFEEKWEYKVNPILFSRRESEFDLETKSKN